MSGMTMPGAVLRRYVRDAPKVELHLHLEGSLAPRTMLALAKRNGVELAAADETGIRAWLAFRDFAHFASVYLAVSRCLCSAADYERAVVDLAERLAAERVRYAEVTTTPALARTNGVSDRDYLDGLRRGRERALGEHGVRLAWVFDIVRSIADEGRRRELAEHTTGLAIECRGEGVVALGLGAIEAGFPPEPFAPWFARARAAGLGSVPHAGETAGPASVEGALEALGADRIGHGVRSVEDPALLERLARERVTLEVCPTSNLRLGVYPSLEAHPLPALLAARVPVTIGSDDPALFATTLTRELETLVEPFGLDADAIDRVLVHGAEASFLDDLDKQALAAEMRSDLARLRQALAAEP